MANNEKNTLLEQDDAMESYLNDMLSTFVVQPTDESANPTMRLVQPTTDADDQRVEAERIEAERIEAERIEAERIEAERIEAERIEAERIEAERIEAERIEAERIEAERIEAERIEAERIEAERIEAERIEAERIEAERIEAERIEAERIEAERIEAERIEAERVESEAKKHHPNAPVWATNRFNAVVVVVNNVKLAFPATLIKEKISFDGELKQVKNPLDWILGLKMDGANFIAVVDTGRLLLNQTVRDINTKPYNSILTLEKSRWGIACDAVLEELVLDAGNINWREKSPDRQWLSGIESNLQLAIIDPEKMFIDDK